MPQLFVWVWWKGFVGTVEQMLRLAHSFWHPPNLQRQADIENDQALRNAFEWAGDYVPVRNGEVYEAILDHAKDLYKEIAEVSGELDKKADDLLKISAAIGAAIAAAGRIASIQDALTTFPVFAAIICLIITMLLCTRARKPIKNVVPINIRTVLEVAEQARLPAIQKDGFDVLQPAPPVSDVKVSESSIVINPSPEQVKAVIAASYHWAVTGTQYVTEWKARLVTTANFIFCLGLTLLIFGFAGPLIWRRLLFLA